MKGFTAIMKGHGFYYDEADKLWRILKRSDVIILALKLY